MSPVYKYGAQKRYATILSSFNLSANTSEATAKVTDHTDVGGLERSIALISYTPAINNAKINFKMQVCPLDPNDSQNIGSVVWFNEIAENNAGVPFELEEVTFSYIGAIAGTTYNIRFGNDISETYIRFLVWETDGGTGGSVSIVLETTTE